jgi:hypothetical protein
MRSIMISAREFESRLIALNPQAVDFEVQVDELLNQANHSESNELLNSIFKFFEAHPSEDVGTPGSLVHFAEQYYPSYKATLLTSLSTSPSVSVVLMANRILNSELSPLEHLEYLSALERVVANPSANPAVRDRAQHFLAYQHAKRA